MKPKIKNKGASNDKQIWGKSLVEKKPGGKNGSEKKWKESPVERKPGLVWKRWKKARCLFLGLIHVKINDEVKLTYYFNHLI